jgi:hypothetical protein
MDYFQLGDVWAMDLAPRIAPFVTPAVFTALNETVEPVVAASDTRADSALCRGSGCQHSGNARRSETRAEEPPYCDGEGPRCRRAPVEYRRGG